MLWDRLGRVLWVQWTHISLSVAWNIVGVLLIERGLRAPGPTASFFVAAFLLALALGMFWGARRFVPLYLGASWLAGLGALWAIVQAFRLDPSLWPSASWRYAGVLLNALGVLGAAWGTLAWLRWRRFRPAKSGR